jgi:hypothetical protein
VSPELDEELVHLTQVSSVAMRVQKREPRKRVPPEHGNDLVPAFGVQQMHVRVLIHRHPREHQPPILVSVNIIRRRLRWKEGELGSHARSHIAHLTPTHFRNGGQQHTEPRDGLSIWG